MYSEMSLRYSRVKLLAAAWSLACTKEEASANICNFMSLMIVWYATVTCFTFLAAIYCTDSLTEELTEKPLWELSFLLAIILLMPQSLLEPRRYRVGGRKFLKPPVGLFARPCDILRFNLTGLTEPVFVKLNFFCSIRF